jgi:hypothetical protein
MKTNINYPSCSKIVKKIITFKHRGKDFLYESLAPEDLPVNVERYEILEGIKKENMKDFKVKIIRFESDIESHLSTWFVKPTNETEVIAKSNKDLSKTKCFPAQQKQSKSETQKGNKRSLKNQASYKSS